MRLFADLINEFFFWKDFVDPETNQLFLADGWKRKLNNAFKYVLEGMLSDHPGTSMYIKVRLRVYDLSIACPCLLFVL